MSQLAEYEQIRFKSISSRFKTQEVPTVMSFPKPNHNLSSRMLHHTVPEIFGTRFSLEMTMEQNVVG